MSFLDRFAKDKRGNVAMMFAIATIPIVGAVGAAIDYSRVSEVRGKLADALDAGVLAVGSQPPMSDAKAFDTVKQWVDLHMGPAYAQYWKLDSVTQDGDGNITAIATGDVETTIARVLGVDKVPLNVKSQAIRSIGKIELALVLDNTGSMKSGDKIGKLKTAATELVDTLAKLTKTPADLKIALVPFSQTVNVGPIYKNAPWLDVAGNSASAKKLFGGRKVNRFSLFRKVGESWGGCVESRAMPYETNGAAPTSGNFASLYVPYFAPDEPGDKGAKGSGAYNNSYLKDSDLAVVKALFKALGLSGLDDWLMLQADILKYKGTPFSGTTNSMGYQYGPNSGCEIAPLTRLTTNVSTVKTAISKMIANGNTDIPMGAAWGWNVLAPQTPFKDGLAYGTKDWTKIMVLMTDGNNQNWAGNEEDESLYSGIGYIWQGRMGITSGNEAQRAAARDARLTEICNNMKAEGIVIYTMRVDVKDGSNAALKGCASASDKFYEVADASKLNEAFQSIGKSIEKLRLAQ
jgi:Flp pilus assembly protein TadG